MFPLIYFISTDKACCLKTTFLYLYNTNNSIAMNLMVIAKIHDITLLRSRVSTFVLICLRIILSKAWSKHLLSLIFKLGHNMISEPVKSCYDVFIYKHGALISIQDYIQHINKLVETKEGHQIFISNTTSRVIASFQNDICIDDCRHEMS